MKALLQCVLLSSGLLCMSCGSERALWIETRENGERKMTLAMTEGIARQLLDSKKTEFTSGGKGGLITRDMLQKVLDGRAKSLTSHDGNGCEAIVYAKPLRNPGNKGNNRLVLETYKTGKQVFRIALPDLEMEEADKESSEFMKIDIGWKSLLPFLAESGGAVYLRDQEDDTEIWLYVE